MSIVKEQAVNWFLDVWNTGDLERVADYVHESCEVEDFGSRAQSARGIVQLKQIMQETLDHLPSLTFIIKYVLVADNTSSVHWHCTIDLDGTVQGFDGLAMATWQDNKMLKGWNSFDQDRLRLLMGE